MDRASAVPSSAHLAAELRQTHQRLEQAYRQIDQDLEAARRVQRHFQPAALPDVAPLRLGLYTRAGDRAGGDCFDVFRIDADHVGFYLATVVGRSVAAALLTICLRRLQTHAVWHTPHPSPPSQGGREPEAGIASPAKVLQRLNQELLALALPDTPFVTMIYGVVDCRTGVVTWSRAGHPQPVHVPLSGPAAVLPGMGNLLGVFPAHCSVETQRLAAGDRLLLYSDGLAPREDSSAAADRLLIAALEHRALPVQEHVERTAFDLLSVGAPGEDATLLALEWQ